MISRVSAEFEAVELAEAALGRIKESVGDIYKTGIVFNKKSNEASKLRHGITYTVLPTAVTTYNYITAVMESPASEDVIPEPQRRRTAMAYVICEHTSNNNVSAILNALGGLNVRSDS